jgi:hypothetical protein
MSRAYLYADDLAKGAGIREVDIPAQAARGASEKAASQRQTTDA